MNSLFPNKFPGLAVVVMAIGLSPLLGMGATTDPVGAPAQIQTQAAPVNPPGAQLSPQAGEVLKLAGAGVSDDVIKAYINNSRYIFNLSPDNIIYMQKSGVSGTLSAEMLNHDKSLRDQGIAAAMTAANVMPQQPVPQIAPPVAPDNGTTQYIDNGSGTPPTEYSALTSYGNWTYQNGYGWGWQPYAGLDYSGFGILGYGGWGFWPGRGWCWSPRGYGYGGGYRGGYGYGYGGYRGYAGYRGGYNYGGVYHGGVYRGGIGSSYGGHSFGGATGGFHSSGGSGGGGHAGSGFSGGGHAGGGGGGGHR